MQSLEHVMHALHAKGIKECHAQWITEAVQKAVIALKSNLIIRYGTPRSIERINVYQSRFNISHRAEGNGINIEMAYKAEYEKLRYCPIAPGEFTLENGDLWALREAKESLSWAIGATRICMLCIHSWGMMLYDGDKNHIVLRIEQIPENTCSNDATQIAAMIKNGEKMTPPPEIDNYPPPKTSHEHIQREAWDKALKSINMNRSTITIVRQDDILGLFSANDTTKPLMMEDVKHTSITQNT